MQSEHVFHKHQNCSRYRHKVVTSSSIYGSTKSADVTNKCTINIALANSYNIHLKKTIKMNNNQSKLTNKSKYKITVIREIHEFQWEMPQSLNGVLWPRQVHVHRLLAALEIYIKRSIDNLGERGRERVQERYSFIEFMKKIPD